MTIINADPAAKVSIVKDLIQQHGNKFITVSFIKKDGSTRVMQCHRSKVLEASVKGSMPEVTEKRKQTLKTNDMISVEEICADKTHQFRTVNARTVTSIKAAGNTWVF